MSNMRSQISLEQFRVRMHERLGINQEVVNSETDKIFAHILHELSVKDKRFALLREQLVQLSTANKDDALVYYDLLVRAINALASLFPEDSRRSVGPLLWKHELSIKERRAHLLHELDLADRTASIEEQRYRMTVLHTTENMARLTHEYQQYLELTA